MPTTSLLAALLVVPAFAEPLSGDLGRLGVGALSADALPAVEGRALASAADENEALEAYVGEHAVPSAPLAEVARAAACGSDPLLALQAYAVAYDAVKRRLLPADKRALFVKTVLPALRDGSLKVVRVRPDQIRGSAAVYDSDEDAYKSTGIDLSDPESRKVALHELVHAGYDGARIDQSREASEMEAYGAGTEYLLRSRGTFREDSSGGVVIEAGNIAELDEDVQYVVYGRALENVRRNRGDLNRFRDASGVDISRLDRREAEGYCSSRVESMRTRAGSVWAMATNFSDTTSGERHDPADFLKKDGFKGPCRAPAR